MSASYYTIERERSSKGVQLARRWCQQAGLLLLRFSAGGLVLLHGLPKLRMLLSGEGSGWMDPIGLGPEVSLALCVFAEVFCGIAVMVGFLTRLSALALACNFYVIVLIRNTGMDWWILEPGVLYLLIFSTLVLTGGGRLSLDSMLWRYDRLRRLVNSLSDKIESRSTTSDTPAETENKSAS